MGMLLQQHVLIPTTTLLPGDYTEHQNIIKPKSKHTHTHMKVPFRSEPFRSETRIGSGFRPRQGNKSQLAFYMATPLIGAGRLCK